MSIAFVEIATHPIPVACYAPTEQITTPDTPIQQDPEKLGGHPTIGSVRVQADVLIHYLASGSTLDEFLADYDAVRKEEALAVLSLVTQAILDGMLTGVPLRKAKS